MQLVPGGTRPPVFALRATTRQTSHGAPKTWRRRPGAFSRRTRPNGARRSPSTFQCSPLQS